MADSRWFVQKPTVQANVQLSAVYFIY